MAVSTPCKVNTHSQEIVNGVYEFPLRCCSCFRLLKPEADVVADRYCLDVFPVLLDQPSFPLRLKCPCGSLQDQDICTISGKGNTVQKIQSPLAVFRLLEVPSISKSQICLDDPCHMRNDIDLQVENGDKFSSCEVHIDIGDKPRETVKTKDELHESAHRTDGALKRVLLRKSSLQKGVKVMQFLLDQSSVLLRCSSKDKINNTRAFEAPTYHWRRNKHSLIDSRKIVLFFSILSSMGTMILIYMTLRIKHISDELARV
ncbi:hypothetical protein H6P81_011484 [Aristolochia fimbriata]|uniref:Uncharacterized protein n=1 Tax=Aristolochia fimbriata TaxID=158543 RepID=A0AAV7ESH5_ARIFI|nr:hypothetical protein H6P81_011484 [Aristolochia fimbriata]